MRTAFEPSLTPPSPDRVRVARAGEPRFPDAAWLETVDITTAIDHLPGARWFLSVLAESELADDLRSGGTWTALVPTDAAVARCPGDLPERVFLPDEAEDLIDLAEHHVARGAIRLDPTAPLPLITLCGVTPPIGEAPWCLDAVPVVTANLRCRNGLIHVIDRVLVPRWLEERASRRSLAAGHDTA